MKLLALAVGLVALLSGTSLAQSPYAGMQTRPIKALSAEQVADLKAGRGMGLAMAAELNGYPGPLTFWNLPTSSTCPTSNARPSRQCLRP
jgi:hypothetical protein